MSGSYQRQGQGQGRGRDRGGLRAFDGGCAQQATPPSSAGRVPPHDLDAEGSLIGAALCGHTAGGGGPGVFHDEIEHLLTTVEPEQFYSDPNGRIWDAMRELAAAHQPIDGMTVISYLRDRERLEQIGGAKYVMQLALESIAVHNPLAYGEIVVRKWRMRAVVAACQRISAEGYGDVGDDDEFIRNAVQTLTVLDEQRPQTGEGMGIAEALGQAEDWIRAAAAGASFGLLTGFAGVDELTGGLQPKELTVLGAPPKTGKTSWARAVAINVAATAMERRGGGTIGQGVIFVSLEMTEAEQALAWACTCARIDSKKITMGKATPDELTAVGRAIAWLKTLPIVIYGRRNIQVRELKTLLHEAKRKLIAKNATPRLVIVDHIQILAKNDPRWGNGNDSGVLGDISRELGGIAVWGKVPVLALSQVTEDERTGKMKARGSGDIEADAQHFWILEVFDDKPAPTFPAGRSTTPVEARLTVKRSRSGPKGSATLWFTPAVTLFSETIWNEGGRMC